MAGKVYEIAFKIAGQMSGSFAKTFKTANSAVKGFGEQINTLNRQASDVGRIVKLRQETGQAARTYVQAKQKVVELGNAIKANGGPTQKMAADMAKAQAAVERAKTALDRKKSSLKSMEAAAGTAGTKLQTLIQREKELTTAAERATAAQQKQQAAMSKMQANNAAISSNAPYASMAGAAAGAGLMSAVKTGAEFESSMSRVAAVSRATDEDLAKMTEQAKQLGESTVWSSKEAAEGMQYLAMAGFKTEDVLKTMPGMLDLASAGAIDLGSAADISSNILTGFGMKASEMGRVGDVLTNAFTSSNTSLESLGQTMKYAAPIAKSMGASIETTAAMAGKLGDAGIQGEMAGTTLRAVMLRLSAPSKAGAKAMEKLGVATTDSAGNMRSYPAILADLNKAMAGMSESAKSEYTKAIFETEAMSGAMVLMEQAGSGALQKYEESLKEAGSAQRVAKKQNDNLTGDYKAMTSALEGVKITIYDSIKPALRAMTQWVTGVVTSISEWAKANPGIVSAITLVAGGIAALSAAAFPALVIFKAFKFAFALLKAPILFVNTLLRSQKVALVAQKVAMFASKAAMLIWRGAVIAVTTTMRIFRAVILAVNIAMRANPIGLVITAILGLIAVGVLVYKNWDTIKAKLAALWSSFSESFPGIAAVVSGWYNSTIKPIVDGVVKTFSGLMEFISGVFAGDWEKAWEGIKTTFGGIFESLSGLAKAPLNAIITMINSIIDGINSLGSVDIMGKKIGVNIKKIPALASGGIATKPTLAMIGEGRESEAVLPLSKLGDMLGGSGAGGSISVSFAPVININGGGNGDVYADVKRGLAEGQKNLKKELERLMANQRRLSYV